MSALRALPMLCLLAALAAPPGARAAVAAYLSPEDLGRGAALVVEGRVERVVSGFDPQRARLATYVRVQVSAVHRGPRHVRSLVLREPGGSFNGLVHRLGGVPVYRVGEEVLLFLEPAADGALRTRGMYFGKFRLGAAAGDDRPAWRSLAGHGTLPSRAAPRAEERLSRNTLIAVARTGARAGAIPGGWREVPEEFERLLLDSPARDGLNAGFDGGGRTRANDSGGLTTRFAPNDPATPVRWNQTDQGGTVGLNVRPTGNPLADDGLAVVQVRRAALAWTSVPESRLHVVTADESFDYVSRYPASPASAYTGSNIVLFDDPYDDISDPSGCSGILAIGGYWAYTSPWTEINGRGFLPIAQSYVIVNNGFSCVLDDPDNLAELLTHEIGHAVGLGHSSVPDSVMRAYLYQNRGPRLGDDDRDAVHCHYPHTLQAVAPTTGAELTGGQYVSVTWSATPEAGADPGVVDLDYSLDGGAGWIPIATAAPNDGEHGWQVPDVATDAARVRVNLPNRIVPSPAPYPDACSSAAGGNFSIVAAPPSVAGLVPTGGPVPPLTLEKEPGGALLLRWSASCSAAASGYAVYEGDLNLLRSGVNDLSPATCAAGTDLRESLTPQAGDRYFLVTAFAGLREGAPGRRSDGAWREAPTTRCAPPEPDSSCP